MKMSPNDSNFGAWVFLGGRVGFFLFFVFFYGDGSSSSVVVLLMDSNPRSWDSVMDGTPGDTGAQELGS